LANVIANLQTFAEGFEHGRVCTEVNKTISHSHDHVTVVRMQLEMAQLGMSSYLAQLIVFKYIN